MNLKFESDSWFKTSRDWLPKISAFGLVFLICGILSNFRAVAQSAPPVSSQDAPHPAVAPESQPLPSLLIQTDMDCSFRLDDAPPQRLAAGEVKRVAAALGEHILTATSTDQKDSWKAVVTLDQPIQKVVVIDLLKVRVARQRAEREAAQLEQEIAEKKRKAQETRTEAERLKRQRTENNGSTLISNNASLPGKMTVTSEPASVITPEKLSAGQNGGLSNFAASQPVGTGPFVGSAQTANLKDPQSLVAAANAGQIERVRDLLSRGVDANGPACAANGCTKPLTAAVLQGDENVVNLLIGAGADVNTRADPKHSARTVLMDAAALGKPKIVGLLLAKGAAVNATDLKNRTALMWASLTGDRETVQILLAHGADITPKDSDGSTAASIAKAFHRDELVPLLEKPEKPASVHPAQPVQSVSLRVSQFSPEQINAAIARGSQQAGQPLGLLLVDSGSQMLQALGQFTAQRGQLSPGTQVSASGFQIRVFTPLEWIAHQAADAAAAGRSFTENTVDADMLRPVLRVWAMPSTPPQMGPNYGLDVSPVVNVVLRDSSRRRQVQPTYRKAFSYERLQGLEVQFSLEDLRSIRESDTEFFITVIGTGANAKDFKVKKKHFSSLPM